MGPAQLKPEIETFSASLLEAVPPSLYTRSISGESSWTRVRAAPDSEHPKLDKCQDAGWKGPFCALLQEG